MKKQIFNLETIDPVLNCFNRNGFEKEASAIAEKNKTSYYAIVVLSVRHYSFLLEHYGESEVNNLTTYINNVLRKNQKIEETYGHISEGDFALLIHEKDKYQLISRLKTYSFIISKYKGANSFDVNLKYGIYEISNNESIKITKMIDYSNETINSTLDADVLVSNSQFCFYDEKLRKIRLLNEDIELKMESALLNNEFVVFYQPKYNLKTGSQDGAEALVRWYDPKKNVYNPPAMFISLFESNGFIVKVDKYVYLKVCEYLSYAISHGRKVFPISVNVSRITAIQPDFIDYYTSTKKKFGIGDNLITIEFTESFAYENYEILQTIIDKLHANGFKCSIDDFGQGYSSYRTLKELTMDEIKLDRVFLEKGKDTKRDDLIIENIINIAKELKMKVVQEGTETLADVNRLYKLGCDVIQGYYYSRPIPLTDYLNFVMNSSSHKIILDKKGD